MPHTPAYRVMIDAVGHLTRVQREVVTSLARDLDCPRASLSLLWVLDKVGELGVGDIAQRLRVDVSVASRQTAALVDAGLAERRTPTAPGADRRIRTIGLTDAGRAFAAHARNDLDRRTEMLFGTWSQDDLLAAATAVDRIAETLAQHTDELGALRITLATSAAQATEPPVSGTEPTSGVLAGSTV